MAKKRGKYLVSWIYGMFGPRWYYRGGGKYANTDVLLAHKFATREQAEAMARKLRDTMREVGTNATVEVIDASANRWL